MADLPEDLFLQLQDHVNGCELQQRCFDVNQYGEPVYPTTGTAGFKREGTVQKQSVRENAPKGEGASR